LIYSVADWQNRYENNRTRELKAMNWVPVPNSHDGDGYTQLVCRENGAAYLGAWLAILQVASKCDPRGTLLRDGGKPHDATSISRMTRLPVEIIQATLDVCLNECNWLTVNGRQEGAAKPQEGAAKPHPTDEEWNGREWKGKNGNSAAALDGLDDLRAGEPFHLEAAHAQRASEEPPPRSAHPPSKSSQFHAAFMAGWCSGFEEVRGVKYDVCGGKDGSAVKRLSALGRPVDDLLATARAAWVRTSPPNWHCQKAVSIAYFASFLNEIRAELTHAPTTHAKPHRNDFIAGSGTGPSTTEILRRRAEREAAERLSRAEQPVAG